VVKRFDWRADVNSSGRAAAPALGNGRDIADGTAGRTEVAFCAALDAPPAAR
jgi:hypothetical protein